MGIRQQRRVSRDTTRRHENAKLDPAVPHFGIKPADVLRADGMHPVLTLDKDNPRQKGKTTGSLLVKEGHINLFGTKRVALVASGNRDSGNALK